MALPYFVDLGRLRPFVWRAVIIFIALDVTVSFVRSIRRNPHDRELWFQALGFGAFFLGWLLLEVFRSGVAGFLIWVLVFAVGWFVRSIRREPHDRVLWFEALACVTLLLGMLLLKEFGVWLPGALIWVGLFFAFTACVVYFGVRDWLRGRRQRRA